MPVNFNLLRQAGPADFTEGLMQGQEQQNALLQQQQQRQLGEIQLRNALRGEQEALAESEAAKGSLSLEDLARRQRQAGLGKQALATEATLAKRQTDRLAAAKTQMELMKTSATKIMNRPESAIQELTRFQQLTGIDMSDDIAEVQRLNNPDAIKQWASGHALEADKLLPKFQSMSVPGVGVQTGTTDYTGKFTPGQVFKEQMSEAQIAQNQIAQGQLNVSRGQLKVAQDKLSFDKQKAEQPQFNAQAGGFIAPPTKENPEGVFIPAKGIQAAKDQGAAVKALQSAGYNVETGEDTISKLIAKSTSGGLQAAGAKTLAFFGKTTEGLKAIAALEGTANQIATDLAGGKLGAGISNADRDFIVAALGDVANTSKTFEERLAGWTAAKNRMMLTGLIPPPKAGGASNAPAATKSGATVSNW